MSKKTMKVISVLAIIFAILMVTTSVFALDPSEITPGTNVPGSDQVRDLGKQIVGIIQTAGVVVAVVVMLVLGIKYMMGSAEEKAEYKKSMIPYLVGAIILFAASTIVNVVYQFAIGIK